MVYKDHRDFFETLEREGELCRIAREVDWDLEVGAIGRRTYEMQGPCLLFEKIKDYPDGFRISNGTSGTWPRVALALGLPKDASIREIYRHYEEGLGTKIAPRVIKRENAPCKENIMIGKEVDLYKFPSPMIHEGDGGRYIGTWDLVVCKDPETGWVNWGMYRFMVHTKDWLSGWPQLTSQLAMIYREQYLPKQKPMPIALVIGADPIAHILATARVAVLE